MTNVIAVSVLAVFAALSLSTNFLQAMSVADGLDSDISTLDEFLANQGFQSTSLPSVRINGVPVGNSYKIPACDDELLAIVIDQSGDSRFMLDRFGDPILSNRRYIFEGQIHYHYPWIKIWRRNAVRRARSAFGINELYLKSPVIAVSETGRCALIERVRWNGYWQIKQTVRESS